LAAATRGPPDGVAPFFSETFRSRKSSGAQKDVELTDYLIFSE